jgi:hypothetical protein
MLYLLFFLLILIISLIIVNVVLTTNAIITNNYIKIGGNKPVTLKTSCFTYRLFCNTKYFEYLKNKLNALGWKEANNDATYVDFVYINYHRKLLTTNRKKMSKKFKNIQADLKSTLNNINILSNKQQLATIMQNSPYIASTEAIQDYIWKDGDIIIIREVNSQKQKGVYVIIDKQSFIELRDKLLAENRGAIVSKYITNPLLYKEKKFHLRIYITIFIDKNGNKKIKYMLNYIKIIIAKQKYVIRDKVDYLDPDINISGGGADRLILWDIDQCCHLSSPSIAFFNKCNKSIKDAINSIPLDSISLYPEQNAGFYTYGADIMLDATGHAWILELNQGSGCFVAEWWDTVHKKFNKEFMNYLFKVYDFLLDEFILPYFGY